MSDFDPIKMLTAQLCRLPGIGERTAMRMVLHLLQTDRASIHVLARALVEVADNVRECSLCCALTVEPDKCGICKSPSRDESVICVVATIQDMSALETMGDFRGLYHVLHGTLAPMSGIGPNDLRIAGLRKRMSDTAVREIILATPPTVEGEATAIYITDQVKNSDIKVTRIASGVPVGGDLQFADRLTLSRAMALRSGFVGSF